MKRFFTDTTKYWNYIVYSAKSQLKEEVANSYLNWIWWVLEPLCFMLIYSFVFGFLFKHKEPNFNVFIFIALAFWGNFNRCIKASVNIVRRNKSIIARVYLPKHALILSNMIVNAFKMLINLGIVFVMLLVCRVNLTWHILEAIPVLIVGEFFIFGCCCILAHFGVFVEDVSNIINIVLQFVYYLTGIFFNIEVSIPKPYSTILLRFNPVAMLITDLRRAFLYGISPNWVVEVAWFAASIMISMLGIIVIYRYENTYVKVI